MKRRLEDGAKPEGSAPAQPLIPHRPPQTASSIVQTTFPTQTIKGVSGEVTTIQQIPLQSYTTSTMPSIASSVKVGTGGGTTPPAGAPPSGFQRLKVEDALSYLDQVKYKFSGQPQVYNDFLDIMKEFKSQCIDTPGVITRVSGLFKGYPELIIGFNTFLPPGYKIEVQANDTGYSLQVSVSMASPPGTTHHTITDMPPLIHQISAVAQSSTPTAPSSKTLPSQPLLSSSAPPPTPSHHQTPYANALPNNSGLVRCDLSSTGKGSSLGVTPAPVASPPPPLPPALAPAPQPNHQTSQPVEFNHAINYVNKIKNRFQGQPEKYKKFLEILHTYQKEQRSAKNGSGGAGSGGKHLTEAEVYSQVAKLFEHQEDLLTEFGQFLPDATNHNSLNNLRNRPMSLIEASARVCSGDSVGGRHESKGVSKPGKTAPERPQTYNNKGSPPVTKSTPPPPPATFKRSIHDAYSPHPVKRHKPHSHAPNLSNFATFENIKKSVRNSGTYENLLRTVIMYNQNLIGRTELMMLMTSVLNKYPEQVAWLRELLATELPVPLSPGPENGVSVPNARSASSPVTPSPDPPPAAVPTPTHQPVTSSHADLDLTRCKRIGTSYVALPKNYNYPRCSGRTSLCRQVLNDTWVSIPAWSEEATFVTSKKTQFEEYIYRCEDERFELDVVIECNASTIRVLEGLQKKMSRMSSEELSRFKLDDSLGGSSPTTYVRALRKLYGEKANDILEGLKKHPSVSVPIILKRLKAKEIEWRQAQKGFNKIWREQNEKYYLKSLDHQGINFKPNDLKALRSKTLYNEIEAAYENTGEPFLVLSYRNRSVLDDAAELLIYHVKRQTGIQKQDKQRIKQLLRHFLPDMFHHPRQELSDDERDADEKGDGDGKDMRLSPVNLMRLPDKLLKEEDIKSDPDEPKSEEQIPSHALSPYPNEAYTLFFGNNIWYLFFRLHQILCDRLYKMSERSQKIAEEELFNSQNRKESTAVALRLKPNENVSDCYGAMLDMVKGVLDCSLDPNVYEDNLRNMFGIHAYIGFTLDRVVSHAVRQLHLLVTDDACIDFWELHCRNRSKGGAGGLCRTYLHRAAAEAAYQRGAVTTVASYNGDNCYKIFIYKWESKVTIELLDTEGDDEEEEEEGLGKRQEKWSSYTENLVNPNQKFDPTLKSEHRDKFGKIVYLQRNMRRWKEELTKLKSDSNSNSGSSGIGDCQKIESCDETQCRILANKKMMFVVNKDSGLYKKNALTRARESHKEISQALYSRFARWYDNWIMQHVDPEESEATRQWLMGHRDDQIPNETSVVVHTSLHTTPYRPYKRYTVHYPPVSPAPWVRKNSEEET